jgi:hypothetical protein
MDFWRVESGYGKTKEEQFAVLDYVALDNF